MNESKRFDRLDLLAEFWEQFNFWNKDLKKQVGLFEIENIDKPNIITIGLNPKEYYQRFIIILIIANIKGWKNQLLVWILIFILKD